MYTIGIFFEGKGWTEWQVSGCEAAYEAYAAAKKLAETIGADNAAIWDTVTTEVLASMDEDGAEEWGETKGGLDDLLWGDNEPDCDECGFDPYEGCYTFDC